MSRALALSFGLLATLALVGCGKIEGDSPGGDTGAQGGGGGDGGGPGGDGGGDDGGGDDGGPGGGDDGGGDDGGGDGGPGGDDGGGDDGGGDDGGGDDGGGDGGDDGGGDDGGGPGYTVADVQQGDIAKGELVTLSGVIATTGVSTDGSGFFVQDEGGGAWSGVFVYVYNDKAGGLGIEQGKTYDITGRVDEYYGLTEIAVEDTADVVEHSGPAGEPTADSVNPDSLSDWELWEGCLVNLGEVQVESVSGYGEALINGDLLIDDAFYAPDLSAGDTISEAVGVISYAYDAWRLYPRSEADLSGVTGGGGGTGSATISDIQTGVYSTGSDVTLEGVVATSDLFDYGFFVQDRGGGAWSGLFVYLDVSSSGLSVSEGDELTISGEVTEYYDWTELVVSSLSDISITGTRAVTTDTVNPATVSDWEQWESCLVEIGPADADTAPNKYGEVELDNGLLLDDYLYDYTPGVSAASTWSNITGLIGYSYSEWRIYPRDAFDLSP